MRDLLFDALLLDLELFSVILELHRKGLLKKFLVKFHVLHGDRWSGFFNILVIFVIIFVVLLGPCLFRCDEFDDFPFGVKCYSIWRSITDV
jgi:hypothetical protein